MLIWSGCTTSFITNPLDLVRARVQVCCILNTSKPSDETFWNLNFPEINKLTSRAELGLSIESHGLLLSIYHNQVHRRSIPDTIRHLWRTERWSVFRKGLTARMTSSSIYSLAVIFGYESVKKMSVLPQYKHIVSW